LTGSHFWLGTITGVVSLTVIALPVALVTVWFLARRRTATATSPGWAWRSSLADVGIVHGTVPWLWMIMLPGATPGHLALVPFRDLHTVLVGDPLTATVQVVGNLLVFAALGFFAPMRFAALASIPRILALAAALSAVVETAQYVLRLDRVSSVDDILLNAAGAALASLASRRWWRKPAERYAAARPKA
jgi:glycopeptide antibiotics resistance protein